MFKNLFTTYENTDPPPIVTEDYKKIETFYNDYMIPQMNESYQKENDNWKEVSTTPEWFKQKSNKPTINQNIVNTARQFIGSKYTWGGSTPSTGFDCSGLIYYIYKQNGIDLPRTVKEMEKVGTAVDLNNVQPGDIICTSSTGPSGRHAKIVSRVDNGQIFTIEAKGKKDGVLESRLIDTSKILTIRRVTSSNKSNQIINYFINKGLTINQAKGIYGNLMQESKGNIEAVSKDGNNSYGIAQWTGSRKDRLFSMYGTNPNLDQQLDFLWWELNNTHKDSLEALLNTTNTYDATKVFMDKFERPHKLYANFQKRLKYANSV